MSIHPKVPIQTETGSACRARWRLPLPSLKEFRPCPTSWTLRQWPPMVGRDPDGFYIKTTTEKLIPGKLGSLCQASYAPHPSPVLANPAGSCQRPPSVSPHGLPSLLAHTVFLILLYIADGSHFISCQPVYAPCLVASVVSVPGPGGAFHSSLPTTVHPCPGDHKSLPLPAQGISPLILPVATGPFIPHRRRTLFSLLNFSVFFSWAQSA